MRGMTFPGLARFSALVLLIFLLTTPAALAGWSVALSGSEMLLGCPFDNPHGPSSGSGVMFKQGLLAYIGPAGGR